MGNFLSNPIIDTISATNKRKREEEPTTSETDDVLNTPKRKRIKSTSKYIYQTLFLDGEDSNVIIHALNKDWKLHKLYIMQSNYFKSMFSGAWKESDMPVIKMDIIDENITEETFKIALGSMYKDYVIMKPVQVVGVVATATLLQMDGLLQQCSEMMLETLSAETIYSYHYSSSMYGMEEVRSKCFKWMLQNLLVTPKVTFIRDLSLECMEKVVQSPDLCVMQVEIDVYSVLKKYVFLKLNPDWKDDAKDLQKSTEQFFKSKLKDTDQCFLELAEGLQYRCLFACVRWLHVINDMASIKLLENDRIVPIKWLDPVFLYGWRRVLSVEQGLDRGPENLDEAVFNESCMRCGRVLLKASEYCWRWVGYNYGLDILVSFSNRLISLKRNTHTQLCPHAVSLLSQRSLCYRYIDMLATYGNLIGPKPYRLTVSCLDDDGREKISQTTGIKRISLGKDEEEVAMVLESSISYPMIISMTMMTVSQLNDSTFPKLGIPDG